MLDAMTLDAILTESLKGETVKAVYKMGDILYIDFENNISLEIKPKNKVINEWDVGKVQRAYVYFDVVRKTSVCHEF